MGQVVIISIGNKEMNGPAFPLTEVFCAIPRKNMNILSMATMKYLNMAHFPTYGTFSYDDFVAHPKTHNMFMSISAVTNAIDKV